MQSQAVSPPLNMYFSLQVDFDSSTSTALQSWVFVMHLPFPMSLDNPSCQEIVMSHDADLDALEWRSRDFVLASKH